MSDKEAAVRSHLSSLCVLLVDDKPINQMVIDALIGRDLRCLSLADDGPSAVAAVRRTQFDLVLMDYHLPGMCGAETTRTIRSLPHGQNVPIVGVTADTTSPVLSSTDLTWSSIVYKPVRRHTLINTIFDAVGFTAAPRLFPLA